MTEPEVGKPAGRRILIADDNVDSASSLAMVLMLRGHEVQTANDGLQAYDLAGEFRPEVILLDIAMPRLNGYDVCRRIREQPWGKHMTIVAVTGWPQAEAKRQSQEAGCDHHFVKPVGLGVLEELLSAL